MYEPHFAGRISHGSVLKTLVHEDHVHEVDNPITLIDSSAEILGNHLTEDFTVVHYKGYEASLISAQQKPLRQHWFASQLSIALPFVVGRHILILLLISRW